MKRAEDILHRIWSTRGPVSTLLLPLSFLYGWLSGIHLRRQSRRAWRAPVPVIVIGNILVGGTGKTPLAQALCAYLQSQGRHPGLISRGYGTRIGARPHLSIDAQDSHWLGDEPALLHAATRVPVAVHPRRALAAQALLAACPEVDVLIADDGLQHRALARDVEIIVQDARGVGNGRLLPAGPLREPATRRLQADWLVTHLTAPPAQGASIHQRAPDQDACANQRAPGHDARGHQPAPDQGASTDQRAPGHESADPAAGHEHTCRRVNMHLRAACAEHLGSGLKQSWAVWREQYSGQAVSAVAGIGQPQRFFSMLRGQGLVLQDTLAPPDHGLLSGADLARLPPGPILLTTKDAIKCRPPYDERLWVIHAQPAFAPAAWMADVLARLDRIAAGKPRPQPDAQALE
ncbi:tetraacyldisaccharide 4'-kinase [Castellaniella sp.]|uniref:tetraacyldisaccharide 4'-kinase n=1 Tax=Castellaniella sp. TaxID=1955812 RepID=UPI00355EE1CD